MAPSANTPFGLPYIWNSRSFLIYTSSTPSTPPPHDTSEASLTDQILSFHKQNQNNLLKELFLKNPKKFFAALKEIAAKREEENVTESGDSSSAVDAQKLNYAEIANKIATFIGIGFFDGKDVAVITPKAFEKAYFTEKAKKTLQPQIVETELARVQAESFWNANAKNVFTSPFNLFRTVAAVSTIVANFFTSIVYALGSISCFADAEVKALRLETAKDLLSRMDHDAINAVCGLGQAIPFVGTFLTNMLDYTCYKYKTEPNGTRKHQDETWTNFFDRTNFQTR